MIRRAAEADMPAIMEIYAAARIFMAERGNPRQWGNGYPGEELLRSDIRKGQLFIEEFDGAIHGVLKTRLTEKSRMAAGFRISLTERFTGWQATAAEAVF